MDFPQLEYKMLIRGLIIVGIIIFCIIMTFVVRGDDEISIGQRPQDRWMRRLQKRRAKRISKNLKL